MQTLLVCSRIGLTLAAIFIVLSPAWAQYVSIEPQSVPRDRTSAPRVGTSALRGRVVDGATGVPVARARVRIMGPGVQRAVVFTDSNGGFVFTNLPAGPFTLSAEKATYMPSRYPDPGRSLRARSAPFILRDGQNLEGVTIPIFHGGAIAGRVIDSHGDPVDFGHVRVLRVSSGSATPSMRGAVQTNDLGEFRVPRLEAGSYLLQVVPRTLQGEEPTPDATPRSQPLPTYYPGVLALDQAQAISLERGQTVTGIDVVLAEGQPGVVSGTVSSSMGRPAAGIGGYVTARPAREGVGVPDGTGTGIRPDGTFRLQLPPGEYVLEARLTPTADGQQRTENEQFGTARVSVAGGATEAVSITVGRAATAAGRVIFEGTTPPPLNLKQVHIPLFSTDGACRSGRAEISANWTFRLEGLSGTCTAPPHMSFGRWTLKAVLHDGEDLLGRTITFEPGQHFGDLEIVFSDRRTELTLNVADERGQPTREYVALVFPTDKTRWKHAEAYVRTHVPPSAELMMQQMVPAGGAREPTIPPPTRRDAVDGLAAGDYYVIAVDDIDRESSLDPAVLDRLSSTAARVTLAVGANVEVALRRFKMADVTGR